MDFLPLFHNLKNEPCLIVGGGSIALRKSKLLLKAGAKIRVVAPEISATLKKQIGDSGEFIQEKYEKRHLDSCVLVISATDISAVNQQVSTDCKALRIPVNVVDSPNLCSVIMPAIVDRSPMIVGITSGGAAPVLARQLRTKIETLLPSTYGRLAQIANEFRARVKQKIISMDGRRRFWEEVFAGRIAERALAGDYKQARQELQQKLDADGGECKGEVYLVGAGPGDPDLLTIKALKYMQQAEVVLHDRLVSGEVLDLVRRDADFIYVGKKRADHAVPQKSINQMLVDYAKQGKRVLRLKGGDPFIFGRGGEEIELLAENDIPFVVVPGITAASGCASYSGIPLTHRDHAQSVRFLTGHLKDGTCAQPWPELVASNQTLVFYMGLVSLSEICEKLIAHGLVDTTPAALIEKGTTPDHKAHISSLKELPSYVQATEIHAPTLLIVGHVVSLHSKLNWFDVN